MKVIDLIAEGAQLHFILEPEHPAEIALLKLADCCEASCAIPPGQTANVGQNPDIKLRVSISIKKSGRGY